MSGQNLLRTALLGSVGLNLFLLGMLVPDWLGHSRQPAAGPGGPAITGAMPGPARDLMLFRQSLNDLPPADADILRDLLEKGGGRFRMAGPEVRGQFETMLDLMKADPFDAPALLAAFEQLSAKRDALDRARVAEVVEALAKMSPEGRHKLAESRFSRRLVEGGGAEGAPRDGMEPHPGAIPMNRDHMVNPPPPPPGEPVQR